MIKTKNIIFSSTISTISLSCLTISCVDPNAKEEFILVNKELKFDGYIINGENKTLKKWNYCLVFPNQKELEEEVKKIKSLSKEADYPWIKDLKPQLDNFIFDYLWGRGLIKIKSNFDKPYSIKLIDVNHNLQNFSEFYLTFKFQNDDIPNLNRNIVLNNSSKPANVGYFEAKFLKEIPKDHNHLTIGIIEKNKENILEMLKYNGK
ncbi:hypothetical protein [Mycoplasmopsis adleri]|uniref:hypothetical protein n=1 Tax=Mycoplasmopsis adleri TaxID=51362 RepID=UPI0038731B03